MVPQQQNQDRKPSGDSGGDRSGRNKNRNRRRPRRRKGKSPGGENKEKITKPTVKFKPQSLVPLGQEPLPPKKVVVDKFTGLKKKRYGIVVFENFQEAEANLSTVEEKSKSVDILNIVIKAEGERVHPQLDKLGKVFAGAAWLLIHERRVEDGWYNEPQY